jgi:hypothetical protein
MAIAHETAGVVKHRNISLFHNDLSKVIGKNPHFKYSVKYVQHHEPEEAFLRSFQGQNPRIRTSGR